MDSKELGYIAGLFEAEGCFYHTYNKKSYAHHVCVKITNNNSWCLNKVNDILLLGRVVTNLRCDRSYLINYDYTITKKDDCFKFAELIFPYVSSRRQRQILSAISKFIDSKVAYIHDPWIIPVHDNVVDYQLELGYVAGLWEGDGSVCRSGNNSRAIQFRIHQSSTECLGRVRRFFGFGNILGPYFNKGNPNPRYEFNIGSRVDVIKAIGVIWNELSPQRQLQIRQKLGDDICATIAVA